VRLRTHLILLTLATVVPVVLFAVGLIIYHTRLERSSLERGMRDTARALALALAAAADSGASQQPFDPNRGMQR